MQYFKLFIITLFFFFLLDMLWLGFIAKNLYISAYKPWLRLENGQLQPLWWAAGIVYVLFVIAILTFVLPMADGSVIKGFLLGGLLGIVIYGIYDFTLLAVFKEIPVKMAFIDWAWGMSICALASSMTIFLDRF